MSAVYSVHIEGQPHTSKNGLHYTKQNVVAFQGRVRVEADADDFFGGPESKPYKSHIMTNPTWGSLFRCFKAQIKTTRDYHHVFLEGARLVRREVDKNGVSYGVVELLTGS